MITIRQSVDKKNLSSLVARGEEQGIPKQEQQQAIEKLRAEWDNKLRELRRN